MSKRSKINITLVVVSIAIVIGILFIRERDKQNVIVTKNSQTGQTEFSGGGTSREPQNQTQTNYRPTVLSSDKIFDLGMTTEEYQALIRLMDTYTKQEYGQKTYVVYSINKDSLTYDKSSDTFTFRMQAGRDSSVFLDSTVSRPEFNIIKLTLKKDGQEVFTQSGKVNERL